MATVSVIIPVFNGAARVGRAIESVFAQRYDGAVEIVVVDDGSTDGTRAALAQYGGRITVVADENRGAAAARNAGVRVSRGEYIALLDDDDVWLPDKLARTVAALERDPQSVLVASDALQTDDNGVTLRPSYVPLAHAHPPTLDELLSEAWNWLPSTWLIRRDAYRAIGGFCEQFMVGLRVGEDTYFLIALRERGSFKYIAEPLVKYRRAGSLAERILRRDLPAWRGGLSSIHLARYVHNHEVLLALVRDKYGARARGLTRELRRGQVNLLASVGLTAIAAGKPAIARQIYPFALRFPSDRMRTALRLGFALLPQSLARRVSNRLAPELARSLAGPAEA
jgi:glycosyltransferase involved in cell wall biosynthesis